MKDRQKSLLKKIIETFIKDAKPLASGLLVGKIEEKVSSATIRNELVNLEKEGYIFQPHTSAGRIPTQKAYEHFVESYLDKNKKLNSKEKEILEELKKERVEDRQKIKNFAKSIADLTKQGVMVAFSECDNYYTGLSNIFSQPEFQNTNTVINLSSVIDHLDGRIVQLLKKNRKEAEVLIGENNPVSCDCSLIVSNYEIGKYKGIIALIGPIRMDYQRNYTVIKESTKLLQ